MQNYITTCFSCKTILQYIFHAKPYHNIFFMQNYIATHFPCKTILQHIFHAKLYCNTFSMQNYIATYFPCKTTSQHIFLAKLYRNIFWEMNRLILMFSLSNSMNSLVSEVLGQKISEIMCFSFQIRSISNESAKLRRLRRLHGWFKMYRGSSGSCGFIKYWRGSKILWEAECACTNLNYISQIFASSHVFRKYIITPKKTEQNIGKIF